MRKNIVLLAAIGLILTVSCSKDETSDPTPVIPTCVTTNMSYVTDIKPILQNNCYSCHGATASGGIDMRTHAVVAANASKILSSIKHAEGAKAMPKNASKLTDCQISKFESWVNASSPNN